jgi:hypothetical protein
MNDRYDAIVAKYPALRPQDAKVYYDFLRSKYVPSADPAVMAAFAPIAGAPIAPATPLRPVRPGGAPSAGRPRRRSDTFVTPGAAPAPATPEAPSSAGRHHDDNDDEVNNIVELLVQEFPDAVAPNRRGAMSKKLKARVVQYFMDTLHLTREDADVWYTNQDIFTRWKHAVEATGHGLGQVLKKGRLGRTLKAGKLGRVLNQKKVKGVF